LTVGTDVLAAVGAAVPKWLVVAGASAAPATGSITGWLTGVTGAVE